MKGRKWISESKILGRCFHADVFEPEVAPTGIVVWFGGSGVTKEKYDARENTVVSIFDEAWDRLGKDLSIIFVYVSAPYDIKFAQFSNFTADKDRWNQHVEKDILSNWPDLPVYLIGNSGGAALAFNGVHNGPRIVGAGGIGADQIPKDFNVPLQKNGEPKWVLNLYYNWDDRVYDDDNKKTVENLQKTGLATCSRFDGLHYTIYYIKNRSFDDLIQSALKCFLPVLN